MNFNHSGHVLGTSRKGCLWQGEEVSDLSANYHRENTKLGAQISSVLGELQGQLFKLSPWRNLN
jgi:hypothetical protein